MNNNTQLHDVWDLMRDGKWRTLGEIQFHTGHPEASVSARLRDIRRLGAMTTIMGNTYLLWRVDRRAREGRLYEYRLI